MRIHRMSHTLGFILHALLLMLLLLRRAQRVRAAPGKADYISGSQLDSGYIEEVMRQAKAAEMASFMNENIDPCDDFYKFACGNWARIYPAAAMNQLSTGLFERLNNGLKRKLKQTLTSANDELDTAEDVQVKNFYQSCMRLREVGRSYQRKMKNLIAEFGSMPALVGDAWDDSDFDWQETIARIAYRYGLIIILGVEVSVDFANNKKNVVYIGEQEFTLETRNMYLDNETEHFRLSYRESIKSKLMSFLGLNQQVALATATELVAFEVQLARGMLNKNDGMDITDISDLTTLANMQQLYAPVLNVERLVNISMGEQIKDYVYDFNPQYKLNLMKILQSKPKRVLANYIFYRLIDEFIQEPGKTTAKREQKCISLTTKYFAKNLDNMIFRRFNNNETADDVELIWRQLKSTFERTLRSDPSLNWISRQTRETALEKLAAMTLQINSYVNDNLTEDFGGLLLQSEDCVENLRQTFMLAAKQQRDQLHEPVKPLEAGNLLSYTPVNILVENTIKLPVSLLQPYYLWAASYPNAIKFGTLASLIGHELIHGFDDGGRKFDARGNANDWWDPQSTTNFVKRQLCFTDQYSNYTYYGNRMPRSIAQSENIADNGGVRLAYAAYRSLQEAQESTVEGRRQLLKEKLPTLNYTNLQLFFISFAQSWCNDANARIRDLQIATDQHMPGELRVIGSLSNFEEFAKEFQCGVGTPMNPQSKCKIY